MVQPIQYTPQFIKTDVGAIQDKLNARQGQYDTAFAGAISAEDQFGQFQVHQKDVDLKNKVIGGFKDRIKSLVDQYGGDYAAASKQLVKEIVNTKQDKFFGLAAERNRLAEEQRRLVQQYGPGAIVIKDVTKPDLVDAQGNYIRPEDLTSDVVSRKQLTDLLDEDHGLLKNKSRESNVASDRTGYYKSITTQGITNNEVESTRNAMYNTLKKNKPELSDDMAMNIADAQARSYVLGSKSDYLANREWEAEQSRKKDEELSQQSRPWFDPEVTTLTTTGNDARTTFAKTKDEFSSNAKNIDDFKSKLAAIDKQIADKEMTFSGQSDKLKKNVTRELRARKKVFTDKLNEYRDKYAAIEKQFGNTYIQLKNSGVSSTNAIAALEKKISSKDGEFKNVLWSQNPKTDRAVNNYDTYSGKFFIEVPGKKEAKEMDGNVSEYLKRTGSSVVQTGANYSDGTQVFKVKDNKSGAITIIHVPADKSSNETLNLVYKANKSITDAYNGKHGLGTFIKGTDGIPVKIDKSNIKELQPGETIVEVIYDKPSNSIKSIIRKVGPNGTVSKDGLYNMNMEAENTAVESDYILGSESDYQANKLQGSY